MSNSKRRPLSGARLRESFTSTSMSPAVMIITGIVLLALGIGVLWSLSPDSEDPGNRFQILGLALGFGGALMSLVGLGKSVWRACARFRRRRLE